MFSTLHRRVAGRAVLAPTSAALSPLLGESTAPCSAHAKRFLSSQVIFVERSRLPSFLRKHGRDYVRAPTDLIGNSGCASLVSSSSSSLHFAPVRSLSSSTKSPNDSTPGNKDKPAAPTPTGTGDPSVVPPAASSGAESEGSTSSSSSSGRPDAVLKDFERREAREKELAKNRAALQRLYTNHVQSIQAAGKRETLRDKNRTLGYYFIAIAIVALGLSYLAVPLYAAFCQMTGFGGTTQRDVKLEDRNNYMAKTEGLDESNPLREVTVRFEANVHPSMNWSFYPCQTEIKLRIGETSLAFYKAKNKFERAFTGVSTYNVLPATAGLYFNKIQCFCFDEQRLRAGEEMDMPLFFFLDPAMADDWRMDPVDQITLSYTFFPVGVDNDVQPQDRPQGEGEEVCPPLPRPTAQNSPLAPPS